MKKLTLIFCCVFLVGGLNLNATYNNPVKEDFDHGSEFWSMLNCWKYWCVDIKSWCGYPINSGQDKPAAVTCKLNGIQWCGNAYYSTAKLYSPWVNFNGSGKITFKHKLSDNSGRYNKLKVYLIDVNGNIVQEISEYVYNYNYNSPHGNPTNVKSASINVTWSGVYRIKWYWLGYGGYSRGVIDDIKIDGDYSSNPCKWCKPIVPSCTDSDGDGCCDAEDDYPNDPTKCNSIFVPSEENYNTVAYEDLWPSTGDFDFNDKVIDRYTVYGLNANNDVVDVEHKFVLRAAGARQHNGFGIRMEGIPPSAVASVTGAVNPQDYTVVESNGTEAGQSDAVVVVWEDWVDVVHITSGVLFFNTIPASNGGKGYSDTVTVKITFTTPQATTDMDFDPFLIKGASQGGQPPIRGSEIHLPWKGPTDLADLTMFGTGQDRSAIGNNGGPNTFGNNYVNAANLPWAIYTPLQVFEYPIETYDITTAYLKFGVWASTNGASFADWYLDEPGYRNGTRIY